MAPPCWSSAAAQSGFGGVNSSFFARSTAKEQCFSIVVVHNDTSQNEQLGKSVLSYHKAVAASAKDRVLSHVPQINLEPKLSLCLN